MLGINVHVGRGDFSLEARLSIPTPGVTAFFGASGAGKTTRVPLKLLDAPWLKGRKIVMLEPRRLAARAAASRMAATLREQVGATVGLRVRFGSQVSTRTRIEVITEGRHDPCVGIRATPIAEAMVAIVLMDHYLRHRAQNADVNTGLKPIS